MAKAYLINIFPEVEVMLRNRHNTVMSGAFYCSNYGSFEDKEEVLRIKEQIENDEVKPNKLSSYHFYYYGNEESYKLSVIKITNGEPAVIIFDKDTYEGSELIKDSNDAANVIVKTVFHQEFSPMFEEIAREEYGMSFSQALSEFSEVEDHPFIKRMNETLGQIAENFKHAIADCTDVKPTDKVVH
jgi:hypothetical protein